jgi:hypothetical protein
MTASSTTHRLTRGLLGLVLPTAVLLGGCGTSAAVSGSPSAAPSGSPTASTATSATATPAPTPTPGPTPCAGADLNVVMGNENSAAGGQQGLTALLANHSTTACLLTGSLGATLMTSTGSPLTTSLESPPPTGSAWLVPDRVALDAWWPQAGEATVTISWHTGNVQPGQCSGAAPTVGEISLSVPGGGSVVGILGASSGVAPCEGVIQIGAITQASAPQAFATATAAAQTAAQDEFAATIAATGPPSSYTVNSGTSAADVTYGIGHGCAAFTYVWQDSAGWHVLDTVCVQNTGYNPSHGASVYIFGPGTGCANVYASAGHASAITGCLTWSSTGSGTQYTIDQGPTYVAETDPTSHQPAGTIWWHLTGEGWVTQDFLVLAAGG